MQTWPSLGTEAPAGAVSRSRRVGLLICSKVVSVCVNVLAKQVLSALRLLCQQSEILRFSNLN